MLLHKRTKREIISYIFQITSFLTSVVQIHSERCDKEVYMKPGQNISIVITRDDIVSYYGRPHACTITFIPQKLDTHFMVDIKYLNYASVLVEGYHNLQDIGFYASTTVEMEANDSERFDHMAIIVRVDKKIGRYIRHGKIAEIYIVLVQDDHSGEMTLTAKSEDQCIVSPNYPLPYDSSERETYEWHIQSTQPQFLELRHIDVGTKDEKFCRDDKLIIGPSTDEYYSQEYCGARSYLPLDMDGMTNSGDCCETTVKLTITGYNHEDHTGFMLCYRTKEESEDDSDESYDGNMKSSSNTAGVAVGATIATVLLVLLFVAAAAVFFMRRRRIQHQRQQRRRRELGQQIARGNRGPGDEDNANSSVFIVGSLVINTQAPPPPYPGPPAPQDGNNNDENGGGTIYSGSGYYARPDGGYVNRHGQIVPSRGTGPSYLNEGFTGDMEEPPPYHALMPGSPYGTGEHFYHPLARNGNEAAAQSNTSEYSVARCSDTNSNMNNSDGGQTQGTPYSVAGRPDGETGQAGDGHHSVSSDAQGGAGQGYDSLGTTREESSGGAEINDEPRYAVPHSVEEPPAYEDSNPPHPPPTYDEALI